MNKAWALPPFDAYIASLTGALTGIEATIGGGPSTPDRAITHALSIIIWTVKAAGENPGGSIWLCGNGGSGTIADHIACDMVKMRGWRAFALTNPALTTTFANDMDYMRSFGSQIAALGRPGDVVIGLSCSGESANVLHAMVDPRHVHVSLSGFRADNSLRKMDSNAGFYVPSMSYAEVQIAHLAILHAMIDLAGPH